MTNYNRKINFTVTCAIFFITLQCISRTTESFVLREPTFELLKPQGVRIYVPDESGLQFFAFHGNVNKRIAENQEGEISGQAFRATNGRWIIEDKKKNLRDGDLINYWFYVQADGLRYTKMDQRWTVSSSGSGEVGIPDDPKTSTTSQPESRLILDENFDSLNTSLWTREIKMPLAPDYEFCVYHNENHQHLIQIKEGKLHIRPLILEDYYGENATTYGHLQLNGCTSTVSAECQRHGLSYSILPPIISGRLNTKHSFSFRYGKIEIRAKFPQGDWIYPELWLEPRYQYYGPGYKSGRILLGLARGNENLMNTDTRNIYDSRRLDFGLRIEMSNDINEHFVTKIRESGPNWAQDFHTYTTIWSANGFEFLVDGEQIGRLTARYNSWLQNNEYTGTRKNAPFDQEFYITIGIGVGGVRVFPDGITSSGYSKPWRNIDAKAMLKFWHAKNQWLPSWADNDRKKTALEIDYVRVWSH